MGELQYSAMEPETFSNVTFRDLFSESDHPLRIAPYLLLVPLVIYVLVCSLLRNHRLRASLESFPYTNRRSFATMSQADAYHIQKNIAELEFPLMFKKALQFALFRTYGIPSISKLLVKTGQLSSAKSSTKRYTDTVLLIVEFLSWHPKSERATEAIGRMNFIHSLYIKSGEISNDDLLYTLSLFALEPMRWINRYEWRQLEDFEKCALGTFWKGVGDAMGIDYKDLKSGGSGGAEWADGLQWLEEVEDWAEEYEKLNMVPHIDNFNTAEETTALLLWHVPSWGKATGKQLVSALMDDRLRQAMMYTKPPALYFHIVSVTFFVRKITLRYFVPPRPFFLRFQSTSTTASLKTGKFFMMTYDTVPWYVKPTVWNRWGPTAWSSRLMGLPLPGDEGDRYRPTGYLIPEVGPDVVKGKGMAFLEKEKEKVLRVRGAAACPFGRVKAE